MARLAGMMKGVAIIVGALLLVMCVRAWIDQRNDQVRLRTTIDEQKRVIDGINASEQARRKTLDDALAQIDKLKRATQTPAEMVRGLQQDMALPQPIALEVDGSAGGGRAALASPQFARVEREDEVLGGVSADTSSAAGVADDTGASRDSATKPGGSNSPPVPGASVVLGATSANAIIPPDDLKPIYNYVESCRACSLQLAAAEHSAQDDASKIAAVIRERDAAVTALRGGSRWRRVRRHALWFGVGVAVGASAGAAGRLASSPRIR